MSSPTLQRRPPGRFSRPLGASETLADVPAMPTRLLLPSKREKRSQERNLDDTGY